MYESRILARIDLYNVVRVICFMLYYSVAAHDYAAMQSIICSI
jgi:hypothetical protein